MSEKKIIKKKNITLEDKRKYAKAGMTVSMGLLMATGVMKTKGVKTLHICSGAALIGFSMWHHMLYQPKSTRDKS